MFICVPERPACLELCFVWLLYNSEEDLKQLDATVSSVF